MAGRAPLREGFRRIVLRRAWLTFVVMGVAFMVFGLSSLNLVHLVGANARFLLENGWTAVAEGGLWQLAGLAFNGYVAMAAYVVLKTCEHSLSDWLAHGPGGAGSSNDKH